MLSETAKKEPYTGVFLPQFIAGNAGVFLPQFIAGNASGLIVWHYDPGFEQCSGHEGLRLFMQIQGVRWV